MFINISFFVQFTLSTLLTQVVSIENFTLRNAVDSSEFSLSEIEQSNAVVVIFTSNYCPYAKLYDRRISSLIDAYRQQNVKFVLINPNNSSQSPEDNPKMMAEKVKDMRWNVPYLIDSKQQVANMFGIQKTPEAFILQKRGDIYQILYRGAIDDNPQVASDVSHHYLKEALDSVIQDKPVLNEITYPTGCIIKK